MLSKTQKRLRRTSIIVTAVAAGFTLLTVLPTFSWYDIDTHSQVKIDGNVHGSYFESGSGTAEDPYEIARPIQLYYLAWLQEMGYFNEAKYILDDKGVSTGVLASPLEINQQYHFYLSQDIDMLVDEGLATEVQYVLPPIGTVKYPFVGSFDGCGHKIKNLIVKNNVDGSDTVYTDDPYTAKSDDDSADEYEILGMFGVVGSINSDYTVKTVNTSSLNSKGEITSLNNAAAFDEDQNYIRNFYIEDITLQSNYVSTHKTLVGAVAGYANAPVNNVGIKSVSMTYANGLSGDVTGISTTGISQNILSKYGTYGYVTGDYEREIGITSEAVYVPKATAKTYVASSTGTAWGGSIDFSKILKRIFKSNKFSQRLQDSVPQYPKIETRIYHDGVEDVSERKVTYDDRAYNIVSTDKKCYYFSDKLKSNISGFDANETIGSYYFIDQTGSNNDHKAYVGGMTDIDRSTAKTVYKYYYGSTTDNNCYYIRSSSATGNNFIGVTATGNLKLDCASNAAEIVKWHYNASNHSMSGHAYVQRSTNYDSAYHDAVRYLNYDGSNFSLGTINTTTWNVSGTTITATVPEGYTIKSGNTYLNANDTYSGLQTTGNPTIWNIQNFATQRSGTISITNNGTTYYLCRSSNTNGTLRLSNSTSYQNYRTIYRNQANNLSTYLSFTDTSRFYYIALTNGNWAVSNTSTSGNRAALTLTKVGGAITISGTQTSEPYLTFDENSTSIERSGQAGYIPLTVMGDNDNTSPFDYNNGAASISKFYTSPMNTGYVVGGYYDKYNGGSDGSSSFNTRNYGDVRISQYANSKISSSYTFGSSSSAGSFKAIYTIDDTVNTSSEDNLIKFNINGEACNENGVANTGTSAKTYKFKKFSSALNNLKKNFRDLEIANEGYIGGVHFMNSTISMTNTIFADRVLINSEYYNNYQMPEDSFDFNLKENGYINFFAGNYHGDNNGFFALHHIHRDPNNASNISTIKQIKYIFENKTDSQADYIYYYTDGTWSDNYTTVDNNGNATTRPTNKSGFKVNIKNTPNTYEFAFDTQWIGFNKDLVKKGGTKLFYFEIPVNKGEYALGSFSGDANTVGCGAYIIYLDISAASQKINRKQVSEYMTVAEAAKDIPYGTQFVSSIPDPITVTKEDENGETIVDKAGLVRPDVEDINDMNSYYGSISSSANGTYTITRNGNAITTTGTSALSTYYIDYAMSPPLTDPPITKTKRRITDYDYNTITDQYVIQITEVDITTANGVSHNKATTTLKYSETGFTANDFLTIATFTYEWDGNGPQFNYSYYLHASSGTDNGLAIMFNNVSCAAFNVTFTQVAANYEITCGTGAAITSSNYQTSGTVEIPHTETIPAGTVLDSWLTFDTTATPIASFRYVTQGDEQILNNFVFTGYNSLETLTEFKEEGESIDFTNTAGYTFNFDINNSTFASSDPSTWVYIYYKLGSGTGFVLAVNKASSTNYIVLVNQNA